MLAVDTVPDPANTPRAEIEVPVRVEVSSDDLPEGQRKIRLERTWIFWRAPVRA